MSPTARVRNQLTTYNSQLTTHSLTSSVARRKAQARVRPAGLCKDVSCDRRSSEAFRSFGFCLPPPAVYCRFLKRPQLLLRRPSFAAVNVQDAVFATVVARLPTSCGRWWRRTRWLTLVLLSHYPCARWRFSWCSHDQHCSWSCCRGTLLFFVSSPDCSSSWFLVLSLPFPIAPCIPLYVRFSWCQASRGQEKGVHESGSKTAAIVAVKARTESRGWRRASRYDAFSIQIGRNKNAGQKLSSGIGAWRGAPEEKVTSD